MNRPQGLPNCNWVDTVIFPIPRFSERKMVVCHGKENHRRMVKWVVLSGCLSGWRKWFPKPFSSTTRPETEPGPRPIKAGLGDQESGVSGGRRLVKKTSIWLSKWGRWALSDRATFSDFGCLKMKKSMSYKTVWRHRIKVNAFFSGYSMTTLITAEYLVFTQRVISWQARCLKS